MEAVYTSGTLVYFNENISYKAVIFILTTVRT
jgi:hypothetical protein